MVAYWFNGRQFHGFTFQKKFVSNKILTVVKVIKFYQKFWYNKTNIIQFEKIVNSNQKKKKVMLNVDKNNQTFLLKLAKY